MLEDLWSVSNIVGFLALIFIFLTFFFDERKTILTVQTFGIIFLGVHFYLIGENSVIFFSILLALRNILYAFVKEAQHQNLIMWIWLGLYFAILWFTWVGFISFLPFLGSVFGTIAFRFMNTMHIRFCLLCSIAPWIVYALLVDSLPTLLVELVMLSSVLINIVRFDILKYE